MCALNPSPLRYNGFNAHILGFLRLIIHPINQVLFFREFGRLVGHKIFLTADRATIIANAGEEEEKTGMENSHEERGVENNSLQSDTTENAAENRNNNNQPLTSTAPLSVGRLIFERLLRNFSNKSDKNSSKVGHDYDVGR